MRRARVGERAFGYELTVLANRRGSRRAFRHAVEVMYGMGKAAHAAIDDHAYRSHKRLVLTLARCQTARTREGVSKLHCHMLAGLRANATHGFRAQGPDVYFGRQHEQLPDGTRRHLRKLAPDGTHQQEGLAKALGVSVATVFRWWRILVEGGVWKSHRPPRDKRDALLNRTGTQVYAQRYLADGTPKCIVDRLPLDQLRRGRRPREEFPVHGGHHGLRADEVRAALAWLDGDTLPY